ncbi:hypothetical protein ACIBSW_10015 [Actinoplanes sp. NPDC049668]|uniref:hypothetical protein n=1 Tax=unclassified Actinoplanes TaxID=2626549 RepID=UPI0033B99458
MVESAAPVWLPFRTISTLVRSDLRPPEGLHVVRDADEWTRQWAGSPSGDRFGPPVPAVDWQTEMCVVAALGACSNTGYSVLIDAIQVFNRHMRAMAWEIRPGGKCVTLCAITYPIHAVAVPAHAGTAELVKRIAYEDCEAAES